MDNRHRAPKLFGTPLSKSLDVGAPGDSDAGPINRRRARLERHQIVQDDQGRRRFHGAFTGGFSAGYYNTVDSVQGFQPKSFKSQRGTRARDEEGSSFDHRPEDYMDEEDFGEFGIAPKKIRLAGDFAQGSASQGGTSRSSQSLVVDDSIGEKILRCMTRNRRVDCLEADRPVVQKNDYHGLGYKPLKSSRSSNAEGGSASSNPLVARLKSGMQLKIAGEAFGVGVLDNDEDNLHDTDEYGYDDISNYRFSPPKPSLSRGKTESESHQESRKPPASEDLPGFVLAEDPTETCDNECLNYPLPIIEAGWKMPQRTEPIVKPPDESDLNRQNINLLKSRVGFFSDKFTRAEASQSKVTKDIEARSGLVPYSDLKSISATESPKETAIEPATSEGVSITRRVVDWRPCSLLCKHFGVDNPYPDNKFCGVRPSDLTNKGQAASSQQDTISETNIREELAPLELRKSIFNVRMEDSCESEASNQDEQNEDQPQVIELNSSESVANLVDEVQEGPGDKINLVQQCVDQEPEIIVMEVPKKEPEVIVLSSSSDSQSGQSSPESDDDEDAYGPPLPPSRQTLCSLDRPASKRERHTIDSPQRFSKSHKRKRHKPKSDARRKSRKHKTVGSSRERQ